MASSWKPSPLMVRILSAFVILALVIGLVLVGIYGVYVLVLVLGGLLLAIAGRAALRGHLPHIARPKAPEPSAPEVYGRRVLVVDDNLDAAESTAAFLRLEGHEVKTVSETSGRVLPELTELNDFFWKSGADGTLRFQRCSDCGQLRHPPSAVLRTRLPFLKSGLPAVDR